MRFKAILGSLVLIGGLSLAACDEQDGSSEQKQAQSSQEQQTIEKFNAYIGVANGLGTPFARQLADYTRYTQDNLKSKKKLTTYSVPDALMVSRVRERLDKAIAMPISMPDIDTPARGFSEALARFAPLNGELSNYADSKEYLVDGGSKARAQDAAYVALLTDVVKTEAAFLEGIQKQDDINLRKAFDEAPKDSEAYYRAGLILEARQSMTFADAMFEANGSAASITPFRESLARTAEMAAGWDRKVRERNKTGCDSMMRTINDFLAMARTVMQHAEEGNYKPKPDSLSWRINNPIQYDSNTLGLRFNAMIGIFNFPRC